MTTQLEYVENPEHGRYTMFPIKYKKYFDAYKKGQAYYWVEDEINNELAKDEVDWPTLDPEIQHFLEHILAFFAVSDGIVNETLTEEVVDRIEIPEIKLWYHFQIMMEDIHNIVYSKLIDTYIKNTEHKQRLFSAIEHYPTIRKKVAWVHKWLGKENELAKLSSAVKTQIRKLKQAYQDLQKIKVIASSTSASQQDDDIETFFAQLEEPRPALAKQILINVIMEGIFFSASFCAIYWIYNQYGKLPGLSKANEFISRDEGMHADYGIMIYRSLKYKLSPSLVYTIMDEAVAIEADFIRSALPKGLLGMNAKLMTQYVKYVSDQLLQNLGYDKHFGDENPFPFMDKQSVSVRIGDFFTDTLTEYGHHSSGLTSNDQSLDFSEIFE
jgi:ribonucleoside-diphosphate reductase subunit M2